MTKRQHTTHFDDCGCLSEKHEGEMKKALEERDAALREADRIRHGHTIEGDFICPNELAVSVDAAKAARLAVLRELREWAEHHDDHGDTPMTGSDTEVLLAKLDEMEGQR